MENGELEIENEKLRMRNELRIFNSPFSSLHSPFLLIVIAIVVIITITGCMTPKKAEREANEAGIRLATEYWQRQTGSTNTFDVSRSADVLTLRIALLAASNNIPIHLPEIPHVQGTMSNGFWVLSLSDALTIGARNDRTYQQNKENIFTSALELDYQSYLFDTSFSGMLLEVLSGDVVNTRHRSATSATVGARRNLPTGGWVASQLAVNVVSLLKGDWSSTVGVDLSMSVPLLRGAGRSIVQEPLIQAERNLMYSIRTFERYRQTYAVSTASSYFNVLLASQQLQNALDNETMLDNNFRRAEMLFEAGRMQRIQLDQAKTDYLSAKAGVISQRQSYDSQLDAFKVSLGLPPEARIVLDARELEWLAVEIDKSVSSEQYAVSSEEESISSEQLAVSSGQSGRAAHQLPLTAHRLLLTAFTDAEATSIALTNRLDLMTTRDQLGDAERYLAVAADALRADVRFSGGVSAERIGGDGVDWSSRRSWNARLQMDAPWSRRRERNDYRRQLLVIDQRRRGVEGMEDSITMGVRQDLRSVETAKRSFEIQRSALQVAKLRVASITLFQQSGRVDMRDVLDAQSSLLTAQNAFGSSVIRWRISELELLRDMGILVIDSTGNFGELGVRSEELGVLE